MLISIIVPAYNEEELLADFVQKVTSSLKRTTPLYELLIVENGSTDKTLPVARETAGKNQHIKVFHLTKPSYGLALKYGFKKAEGDYVVVFNVDFWDPEFIKIAAEQDLKKADIVVGSKNLPESNDKRPFPRKLISRGFMLFLRLFLGFEGSDTHGIKIFRRSVLDRLLPKCKLSSGLFDTELLIRAQRAGFKIAEVPVDIREVRPPRFKGRFLSTPKDLCELFLALR